MSETLISHLLFLGVAFSWTIATPIGSEGAQPGQTMPAKPETGTEYFRDYFKTRKAQDQWGLYSVGRPLAIKGRRSSDVIVVLETTPLEPDSHGLQFNASCLGLIRIEEAPDATPEDPESILELGA